MMRIGRRYFLYRWPESAGPGVQASVHRLRGSMGAGVRIRGRWYTLTLQHYADGGTP